MFQFQSLVDSYKLANKITSPSVGLNIVAEEQRKCFILISTYSSSDKTYMKSHCKPFLYATCCQKPFAQVNIQIVRNSMPNHIVIDDRASRIIHTCMAYDQILLQYHLSICSLIRYLYSSRHRASLYLQPSWLCHVPNMRPSPRPLLYTCAHSHG